MPNLCNLIMCLMIGCVSVKAQCGCDTPLNRAVLQDLYAATRGPLWFNSSGWLLDTPLCDWYGVSCVGECISTIYLSQNNLNGTLSDSLAQLSNLTLLNLQGNLLTGLLPNAWSAMTRLETLILCYNQLTGTLPLSWSAMNALQDLSLGGNQLTGTLPTVWSALTQLLGFEAGSNQLTGTLPAEWSSLNKMESLDVSNNQLTGRLPDEWSAWAGLLQLHVTNNRLRGPLPASWSSFVALQRLDVSHNALTGVFPTEWSVLTALQNLEINDNQLTGCFSVCPFARSQVNAVNNKFSGVFNFSCVNESVTCVDLQNTVLGGNSFCGSLCGLPACGNSSCVAAANTIADGSNIGAVEVSSQTACCAACSARQQCVAAEWYASTGVCILKSAIGATSPKPNVTLLIQQDKC